MNYKIALIRGDGIGPEVVDAAVGVLKTVGEKYGHSFEFVSIDAGGNAIDKYGEPLPAGTLERCLECDSVLLGAVGGPKWDSLPGDKRPEKALFGLRKGLGLYINLRPAKLFSALADRSPLRKDIVDNGIDVMIVRELTGGLYFGERGRRTGVYGPEAYDTEPYSVYEIDRIARAAFKLAQARSGHVISVDKANVLETSRLWRETVHTVVKEYEGVTVDDMLVDNAAMQLVKNPAQFNVLLTSNIFGDILSDEAGMITGSIGMLPSASLGEGNFGMYEPVHGTAPDIAGTGKANPIATILSAAMMLEMSFGLVKEAKSIENAVTAVLDDGFRTADIAPAGVKPLTCTEMAAKICEYIS